jgi:hypothetical protein
MIESTHHPVKKKVPPAAIYQSNGLCRVRRCGTVPLLGRTT